MSFSVQQQNTRVNNFSKKQKEGNTIEYKKDTNEKLCLKVF